MPVQWLLPLGMNTFGLVRTVFTYTKNPETHGEAAPEGDVGLSIGEP